MLPQPPLNPWNCVARRAASLTRSAIQTTSAGHEFDAAAAILGFHGPQTYEGQAAMWLESLARQASGGEALPFHLGLAEALAHAARELCEQNEITTIGLSGGVWQNSSLSDLVQQRLGWEFRIVLHRHVPANDGGISLGQAALASVLVQRN